jgi:integrase
MVPLLPQAAAALRAFCALKIYGDFSNSSLNKALKRGCERTGVPPFNPYKLRHLLGTTASKLSSDERGVSELMLHTDPRQTRRYTEHAASTRILATVTAMKAALPMPAKPGPKLVKRA